jgi:site-specific recombinase
VVDLVRRASRTQFTALVGNVVMVVPLALAIDGVVWLVRGHHVLDEGAANALVRAHQPFSSATFVYAATTAVWLWAASLVAGGVENWFIVRELPGAIASNRLLRRLIGPARALTLSRRLEGAISGLGGNIGFGLLLGFMPVLIGLFGIPLEVRHVTFVAGQLVFAALSLGPMALARSDVLAVVAVVPVVGLINFAVSFLLALVVALRARGLGNRWLLRLARAVSAELLRHPKGFFLAPPDEKA